MRVDWWLENRQAIQGSRPPRSPKRCRNTVFAGRCCGEVLATVFIFVPEKVMCVCANMSTLSDSDPQLYMVFQAMIPAGSIPPTRPCSMVRSGLESWGKHTMDHGTRRSPIIQPHYKLVYPHLLAKPQFLPLQPSFLAAKITTLPGIS